MNKNRFLLPALFVLMVLPFDPLQADIGKITIDGQTIPPILFKGYSVHAMTKESRCPPTSDSYIRDRVIRRALVVLAAREQGLKVPEREQANIDKFKQKLEYLGPDGDGNAIASAEHLRHFYEYSAYISHFPARATHEDILSEYKRLIKAKDPRFTDVVLVRHTPLEFVSEDDARQAVKLLESGTSIDKVTTTFDEEFFQLHIHPEWYPIYDVDGYTGDGRDLKTGSAVSIGGARIIYFNEVKFRTRIRPFTRLKHFDNWVYDRVKSDVLTIRQRERDLALWQAADVREDGEPIAMLEHYPSCP